MFYGQLIVLYSKTSRFRRVKDLQGPVTSPFTKSPDWHRERCRDNLHSLHLVRHTVPKTGETLPPKRVGRLRTT